MKRFRFLLVAAGAVTVLLLAAAAVVFSATFQTWAVRRALAARPDLSITIGEVDAGLGRVVLRDVTLAHEGAVAIVPQIEADLPVWAAVQSETINVSRLVAKGWTVDLSRTTPRGSASRVGGGLQGAPGAVAPLGTAGSGAGAALQVFRGVFGQLRLPVDLTLSDVRLEGDIVLPERRGRVNVALSGGGVGTGREGNFAFTGDASLTDPAVNRVTARGTLVAAMDTPRSFSALAVKLDATATGAQWPGGVSLTAGATAARASTGETYSARIVANERQLLGMKADFPRDASRLEGTWKLDVRDVDVAPFTLGQPLPSFTLAGEGAFDADAAFTGLHVAGRVSGSAGRLEVLRPELAAVGAVKTAASFDVTQRDGRISVQQLEAEITGARPVLTLRALQPFDLQPELGGVKADDPARDALGVVVHALPLAWLKPILGATELTGGDLRGEFVAAARVGGWAVRSQTPLAIERLSVGKAGEAWVKSVDVSGSISADITPQGWQLEGAGFSGRAEGTDVITFDARAGKLAGSDQPIKTAGKVVAQIPAILRQPFALDSLALTAGKAAVEFAASIGGKTELQAKVTLRELAANVDGKPAALPDVSTDLRIDVGEQGTIALNVPLILEREGRRSDLTVVGKLEPEKAQARAIEAQVTSALFNLKDAEILSAMFGPAADDPKQPGKIGPPWRGVHGSLSLQLKKVVYSETFELTNVTGRVRLDAEAMRLESLKLGVGETGQGMLEGALTFDVKAPQPFAWTGALEVKEFDPGPLLRNGASESPPVLEGKFDITSRLKSRARTVGELAEGMGGSFQLTSRAGVFRALPISVGNIADSTSTIASLVASASSMIGGITGRKETTDITNRSQAVSELARTLSAITYDQLSVTAMRDDTQNFTLSDFSMIAPEVRLRGSGRAMHQAGAELAADAVTMEFALRAQGRTGELLRYLGLLETQLDDLGYAGCTVPIAIGGTLGSIDASDTSRRLVAAAFEKAGFIDKAAEWLAKQRNGKPARGTDGSYDPGK